MRYYYVVLCALLGLTACSNEEGLNLAHIELVKQGKLPQYPQKTIGAVFDAWSDCDAPRWYSFTDQGQDKVMFKCSLKNFKDILAALADHQTDPAIQEALYQVQDMYWKYEWVITNNTRYELVGASRHILWPNREGLFRPLGLDPNVAAVYQNLTTFKGRFAPELLRDMALAYEQATP